MLAGGWIGTAAATAPEQGIEKALVYAETQGWRIVLLNGHAWGKIQCPWNDSDCRCGTFCQVSVWSTPRVPEHMAHNIHRAVDGCARQMAAVLTTSDKQRRVKGGGDD
jgi:hypothetical protein